MERFWKYKLDHVLFWVITVGFHMYTRTYIVDQVGWGSFFLEIIVRNGLLATVIYVHLEYLIPSLAQQGRIIAYSTGFLASLGLYIYLKDLHDVYLSAQLSTPPKSFLVNSFYNGSIALFYLAFSLALHLSKEWFFQREKIRQMEIEKLNSELEYLKLQINPHFLFNSLNTIYFQIDKSNAQARETLLKFSDLLRYPLYECNGSEVTLEKEISYLKNYIELQRLRKDANYPVAFETRIQNPNQRLAPLLLIPFVENAFKHISHFPERSNEIQIGINQEKDQLSMKVFNTCEPKNKSNFPGGIGLKNARRRLELIYGLDYSLDICENESTYEVNLKIPLHET